MASITISSPGGAQTNPTDAKLPFNNGGVFGDSMLVQESPTKLYTNFDTGLGVSTSGFIIDNTMFRYQFGDMDGYTSNSLLDINSAIGLVKIISSKLSLNADSEIELNGLLTSPTAGGSSGLHLELTINGTKYKIQLLDA